MTDIWTPTFASDRRNRLYDVVRMHVVLLRRFVSSAVSAICDKWIDVDDKFSSLERYRDIYRRRCWELVVYVSRPKVLWYQEPKYARLSVCL